MTDTEAVSTSSMTAEERAAAAQKLFPIYRLLSLSADFMIQFSIPIVVYKKTGSIVYSGLSFFLEWLPRILLVPLLGGLVDRYQNKKQFIVIDSVRVLLLLAIGTADSLVALIILLSFFSILNGYAYLVVERTVSCLTEGSRSGSTQAKMQSADNIAQVAGPAIAGGVLSYFDFDVVAAIGIAMLLVGMTIVRRLNIPEIVVRRHPAGNQSPEGRFIAFKIISRSPKLVRIIVLTMMINLVEGIMVVLLPAIMIDNFGKMPWGIGLLVGTATGFSAVALYAISFFLKYVKLHWLAIFSGVLMMASALALGIAREMIVFSVSFVIFIVGRTVFTVYMRTERLKEIPKEHLGKSIALMISMILLPMPLAGAVAALLGEFFLSQNIILLLASVASLITIAITIVYRRLPW